MFPNILFPLTHHHCLLGSKWEALTAGDHFEKSNATANAMCSTWQRRASLSWTLTSVAIKDSVWFTSKGVCNFWDFLPSLEINFSMELEAEVEDGLKL